MVIAIQEGFFRRRLPNLRGQRQNALEGPSESLSFQSELFGLSWSSSDDLNSLLAIVPVLLALCPFTDLGLADLRLVHDTDAEEAKEKIDH